jgi:hypothetical protein
MEFVNDLESYMIIFRDMNSTWAILITDSLSQFWERVRVRVNNSCS